MYRIKTDIPSSVFRGYDLRGVVDKDLDEDAYYTLGLAYGTFLARRRITESAVGRDNRLSSEKYAKAFIKGLNDTGVNTFDIGLSLSQIVYYSAYHFNIKGGAMITASHNPKEYNGLKLGVGYSDTMVSDEVEELKAIVRAGKFQKGQGQSSQVDIFPDYSKNILKHFKFSKKWKIVVDGCNTGSGIFYPKLFRQLGFEVIEQNCKPDGNFPSGIPDPTEVKVLERLAKKVISSGADIGLAYDTDGDRIGVVNEKGQVVWMDTIVALFAQDILEFLPGSPIVFNTFCSKQVTDAILAAGGKPVIWITGHSFIKAKVKEMRAPFGGELSGHIFFMDNFYGHDDGAFASLRLLAFLERRGLSVSQAVARLTQYVSSPEIKLGLPNDEMKFAFVSEKIAPEFKKHWPNAKYVEIDGVRMETENEMAIIRASQNGPYIGIKFEGRTRKQYEKVKVIIRDILRSHPEINWDKGANTHAFD